MLSKSLARVRKKEKEDLEWQNIILGTLATIIGVMLFFRGTPLQVGVYYGNHIIFNLIFIFGGSSIIVEPLAEIKKQKFKHKAYRNKFEYIIAAIGVLSIAIGIIGFALGISWRADLEMGYGGNDILNLIFILGGVIIAIKSLVKIKKKTETYPYEFIRLGSGILGIIVGTVIFLMNIL